MIDLNRHTPAPWTIVPAKPADDDEGAYTSPASIDGDPVCTFGSEDGSGTLFENEADWHLISKAPDMLAALRRAKFDYEEIHDIRPSTLAMIDDCLKTE